MSNESSGSYWLAAQKAVEMARQLWATLSLTRVQAVVAVLTGLVTITVGLHSLVQFAGPGDMGELLAVVQDASEKGVTDATIEILTPQNAVVATLTSDSKGQVRQTLRQGFYTVHVNHPRYVSEVRQIQVYPQQTVAIKTTLRPGLGASVDRARRTVDDGVNAVRRAFSH